jgi:hypothetical protein
MCTGGFFDGLKSSRFPFLKRGPGGILSEGEKQIPSIQFK